MGIEDVKFEVKITGSFDSEGSDPEAEIMEWFEGVKSMALDHGIKLEDIDVGLTNIIGVSLN